MAGAHGCFDKCLRLLRFLHAPMCPLWPLCLRLLRPRRQERLHDQSTKAPQHLLRSWLRGVCLRRQSDLLRGVRLRRQERLHDLNLSDLLRSVCLRKQERLHDQSTKAPQHLLRSWL